MVSMLTFTLLTKPAQLASGDLHLVSERIELGFGRIAAYKPANILLFCSSFTTPNCLSLCPCFLPALFPIKFPSAIFSSFPGFREGRLGAKPAAPVLLLSLTQRLLFTSGCPSTQSPQDLGCPGPCLSRLGCTLFLRGGGLRFRLRVGMVVV